MSALFRVAPLLLTCLLALPARADRPPAPVLRYPVTDQARVLSNAEGEAVARALVRLREERGVQMAVLLVRSTRGEPIEDFALRVAEAWRGGAPGRDDGLLLVLAVGDRRSRLEVGYGLEDALPDTAAVRLLEAVAPLLREVRYGQALLGVITGVDARLAAPGTTPPPKPAVAPPVRHASRQSDSGSGVCAFLGVLLCVAPLVWLLRRMFAQGATYGSAGRAWTPTPSTVWTGPTWTPSFGDSSGSDSSSSESSSGAGSDWSGSDGDFGGGGASSDW